MFKTVSVTKLRNNLPKQIEDLPDNGAIVVIKHSKIAAYLLSPTAYENLLERLEKLEDIQHIVQVLNDEKQYDNTQDANDLFKELGI